MNARARSFLDSLPPDVRGLVRVLRMVIKRTVPQTEESVVWGSLSYHRPEAGGRVKGSVCLIVVKGNEVRLDFIHGVRLDDPTRLLKGDLVSKRFVPIRTTADAKRPEVAALIRKAAALDPTQWDEHCDAHLTLKNGMKPNQ